MIYSTVAEDLKKFKNGEYREGHALPAITHADGRLRRTRSGHFIADQNQPHRFGEPSSGVATSRADTFLWSMSRAFTQRNSRSRPGSGGNASADFEHTLFDAGGFYASPAGTQAVQRGFRIFANRNKSWQMRVGQSTDDCSRSLRWSRLARATHLAVTVATAAWRKKRDPLRQWQGSGNRDRNLVRAPA